MVRAVPLGAATRRDSGRPNHVERRRRISQACDVDDQLHGVRHDSRLDARHPRQGARGRPHVESRLRHRLRVLDAAAARRLRQRRRRLHVRPAVVHGYLRQDVLHRLVGRRAARRADGHVRRRPSRCDGFHSRQARERPVAPVQSVAADHRRLHAGREGRSPVAARVSADAARGRGREHRPRRYESSRLARVAGEGPVRRRRPRARRLPRLSDAAGAPHVGRHHVVDLRLRRAGVRAHRSRQRDEQQLVVRGHSRH